MVGKLFRMKETRTEYICLYVCIVLGSLKNKKIAFSSDAVTRWVPLPGSRDASEWPMLNPPPSDTFE